MISLNLKKRINTSILLFFLFFLILNYNLILVYSLIVLGVISIIEFYSLIKKIIKNKIFSFFVNFTFTLYISFFCIMFFFFSNFFQLKIILFSLLLGCVASDIGGFIFGKLLKGPKLTKISPNKTISGAIGSIIFTSLTISISLFYFTKNFNYLILIICLITSVASQIGDLLFSFLKRKAKIKDTGNFLPGHGGVLDRLDGILFGVPIGIYALTLFY
jgi:phosphatidate cytidylyltransferase